MASRLRPWVLVAVAAGALAILGASCRNNSNKPPVELKSHATRLEKLESGVETVSALTNEVNTQIETLRGKDEGLTGELSGLSGEIDSLATSISDLRKSIDTLRGDIQANKNTTSLIQKKLDELSSKVGGIDQRLWVLEARYNDHLRKYHGGG